MYDSLHCRPLAGQLQLTVFGLGVDCVPSGTKLCVAAVPQAAQVLRFLCDFLTRLLPQQFQSKHMTVSDCECRPASAPFFGCKLWTWPLSLQDQEPCVFCHWTLYCLCMGAWLWCSAVTFSLLMCLLAAWYMQWTKRRDAVLYSNFSIAVLLQLDVSLLILLPMYRCTLYKPNVVAACSLVSCVCEVVIATVFIAARVAVQF